MPIKFVLNDIKNDFEYELLNALEYQEWYAPELYDYQVLLMGEIDDYTMDIYNSELNDDEYKLVPIGDMDFVRKFTNEVLGRELKPPISIPNVLYQYLNRTIVMAEEMESEDVYHDILNEIKKRSNKNRIFIKNVSEYKKYNSVINIDDDMPKEVTENMDNRYMFSEYIGNIESEFRIFVYIDEIIGCCNYLGDPTKFPDIDKVQAMIKDYKYPETDELILDNLPDNIIGPPPAYTIDVAVTPEGTKLLEIHPLISCGLYGLREYDKLPQMMARAYRWALKAKLY